MKKPKQSAHEKFMKRLFEARINGPRKPLFVEIADQVMREREAMLKRMAEQ